MDKIIFTNDQELHEICTIIPENPQFFTLESTVQKSGKNASSKNLCTVKSRITKEPFAEVFDGIIYCTKKEYVTIYHDYVKATINLLKKEGNVKEAEEIERNGVVKSGELPWGTWDVVNLIISHKENFYLRYYQNLNVNYQHSEFIMHYADGTILSDELVERYWKEFASKQDSILKTRCVTFSNITRAVVNGNVLIREGFEIREDSGKILDWHTGTEERLRVVEIAV